MARMARFVAPGYPHHVTQRGNRRQKTFFCDDDYRYYIELLAEFSREYGTEVWAYCLMPNHVHLVMVPSEEDGLRATLGEAHRRYTRHVNFRSGWRGHLWQERFHSFVMDEQYLLATVRYVERNPVVADLCLNPFEWEWSSAAAHSVGVDDDLVRVKPMLDRIDSWKAYLSDVCESNDEHNLIERHTRTGRPLGNY
jgi:putative transposase